MNVDDEEVLEFTEPFGESDEDVVRAVKFLEEGEVSDALRQLDELVSVEFEGCETDELCEGFVGDGREFGEGEIEVRESVRRRVGGEDGEGDLGDGVVREVDLPHLGSELSLDDLDVVLLRLEDLELGESVRCREVDDLVPTTIELPEVLETSELGGEGDDHVSDDDQTFEVDELSDLGGEVGESVEGDVEVEEGWDLADDGGEDVEGVVRDVEVFESLEVTEVRREDRESIVLDFDRHETWDVLESSLIEVGDPVARDVESSERDGLSNRGRNSLEGHVGHSKLSEGGAVLNEVGGELLERVLGEVEVDDGPGVTMKEDGEDLEVAS